MEKNKSQLEKVDKLIIALLEAGKEGLRGITLTNTDPKADYYALVEKNKVILAKYNLSIDRSIDKLDDGSVIVHLRLIHSESGQYKVSTIHVHKRPYSNDVSEEDIFFRSRLAYELMLNIASENDAIEADLFGPNRNHRHFKLYDKTVDYIENKYFDSTEQVECVRINRKKFEKLFLGMTSEEEAETKFEVSLCRRFSWSDIKLFLRCKRCFYNKYKLGIHFKDFDNASFGLEKITETLLKREFDHYRAQGKKHPIMNSETLLKPLKDKRLDDWRTPWKPEDRYAIKGVQYQNVWENWMVYGGVDDIWINDKKELVIVDYKSSTNGKIYPEYKQQLEFYSWIFRKRNYAVSSIAYLLMYRPILNKDSFDWRLEFEPRLISIEIDDSWVQEVISAALECLLKEVIPNAGHRASDKSKKCEQCDYFDQLTTKITLHIE